MENRPRGDGPRRSNPQIFPIAIPAAVNTMGWSGPSAPDVRTSGSRQNQRDKEEGQGHGTGGFNAALNYG